jgi:hypothetical protein
MYVIKDSSEELLYHYVRCGLVNWTILYIFEFHRFLTKLFDFIPMVYKKHVRLINSESSEL